MNGLINRSNSATCWYPIGMLCWWMLLAPSVLSAESEVVSLDDLYAAPLAERAPRDLVLSVSSLMEKGIDDQELRSAAHYLLGLEACYSGRLAEARSELNQAKSTAENLVPIPPPLRDRIDLLSFFVRSFEGETEQSYEVGQALYQRVGPVWSARDLSFLTANLAAIAVLQSRYAEALRDLDLSFKHAYDSGEAEDLATAHYRIAKVFQRLHDLQAATLHYEKAIALCEENPENREWADASEFYAAGASTYLRLEDFDRAQELLDVAIGMNESAQSGVADDPGPRLRLEILRAQLSNERGEHQDSSVTLRGISETLESSGLIKVMGFRYFSELANAQIELGELSNAESSLSAAAGMLSQAGTNIQHSQMEGLRSRLEASRENYEGAFQSLSSSFDLYQEWVGEQFRLASTVSRERLGQTRVSLESDWLARENEIHVAHLKKTRFLLSFQSALIVALVLAACFIWRLFIRSRALEKESRVLAKTDALTQLANRRDVMDFLAQTHEAGKGSGSVYSVIALDLDHFKSINDTYGHSVGDSVLRIASKILQQATRGNDRVARFGGEEFLVVLPDAEEGAAVRVAERTREYFENRDFGNLRQGLAVTCSLGVADSLGAVDFEEVIRRADAALYRAKGNGRNRVARCADLEKT